MVEKVVVRLINKSANPLPAYATKGSSGMDLRCDIPGPITLKPLKRVLLPTGIFIEIPQGYEVQVRPRSGLAVNKGLTCLNSPGTVDSDYRGELKVLLVNLGSEEQVIEPGERIAQMVLCRVEQAEFELVHELNDTDRGDGGFGHTGLK